MSFYSTTVASIAVHIAKRVSESFTSEANLVKLRPSIEMPAGPGRETLSPFCLVADLAAQTGPKLAARSTLFFVSIKGAQVFVNLAGTTHAALLAATSQNSVVAALICCESGRRQT